MVSSWTCSGLVTTACHPSCSPLLIQQQKYPSHFTSLLRCVMCCGSFMVSSTSSATSIKFQVHATHTHTVADTDTFTRLFSSISFAWVVLTFINKFPCCLHHQLYTLPTLHKHKAHYFRGYCKAMKRIWKKIIIKKVWQNYIKYVECRLWVFLFSFSLKFWNAFRWNFAKYLTTYFWSIYQFMGGSKTQLKLQNNSKYNFGL